MMEAPKSLTVEQVSEQRQSGEDLLDLALEALDKNKRGEQLSTGEMEALKAIKAEIEKAEKDNTQ